MYPTKVFSKEYGASFPRPKVCYWMWGDAEQVEQHLAAGGEWRLRMDADFDRGGQLQREGTHEAPLYTVQAVMHTEDVPLASQPQVAFGGFEQFIIAVIRPRVGHNRNQGDITDWAALQAQLGPPAFAGTHGQGGRVAKIYQLCAHLGDRSEITAGFPVE